MTRSLYVLGGAGVGKSTFVADLTAGMEFGPFKELAVGANSRGSRIALRGHSLPGNGVYIGKMRDEFPGTDGLDRACGPTGARWLAEGDLPTYIISEGATLANEGFLTALATHTELYIVHMIAPAWARELWCSKRGSNQAESFLKSSATKAEKMLRIGEAAGAISWEFDSTDFEARAEALKDAKTFLGLV